MISRRSVGQGGGARGCNQFGAKVRGTLALPLLAADSGDSCVACVTSNIFRFVIRPTKPIPNAFADIYRRTAVAAVVRGTFVAGIVKCERKARLEQGESHWLRALVAESGRRRLLPYPRSISFGTFAHRIGWRRVGCDVLVWSCHGRCRGGSSPWGSPKG